jgi:hypothetical protein
VDTFSRTKNIRNIPRFSLHPWLLQKCSISQLLKFIFFQFSSLANVKRLQALLWFPCRTQYTVGIDHPYSRDVEESTVRKGSDYICEICAKVIRSTYSINKHMNSHFRFSAVTCNYCGKWICNFHHWTKHRRNCVSAKERNVVSPEFFSRFGMASYECANTDKYDIM